MSASAATQDRAAVLRVALVGRQNSGKTSLLMHLTGTAQRPVNFPGSSVEGVESECVIGAQRVLITDLPGISSLHALSRDEEVTLWSRRGRDVTGIYPEIARAVAHLAVDDFVLDDGSVGVVALTTAEFDLLWLLAFHAGEVLSRDHIYRELRGMEYDGLDRSMDLRVARLRRKLGDDGKQPRLIKSVRGSGYLLVVGAP